MKLSVIIITYNHEKFISQAIEGVLMQKANFNFELIIGEDFSTDHTRKICLEYKNKYPEKINLLLHENNIGMMQNFIQTLKSCNGKYIALCEGDDYWTDPYKLQKQVDFLESNPDFSGCFHDTEIIKNGKVDRMFREHKKTVLTPEDTISTISPFHTSSFVYRNLDIQLPKWMLKVASGDMALFSVISSKGNLGYIPRAMSIYRKHDDGITNTSVHLGLRFHKNRISLIKSLNKFHKYKYKDKCISVIKFHKREIKQLNLFKIEKMLYFIKVYRKKIGLRTRIKRIFKND